MPDAREHADKGVAKRYLSLFESFNDACARHEASQDPEFRRLTPDAAKPFIERAFDIRSFIGACRTSSLFFHRALERLSEMPWSAQDRDRLAVHVTMLALLPPAFSDPGSLPRTSLGDELRQERGALKQAYPHIYGDGLWRYPLSLDEEEDIHSLSAHLGLIDDAVIDSSGENPLDLIGSRMELEGLMIEIEEVDPVFLAETIPIRAAVVGTADRMIEEDWGVRCDWLRRDAEQGPGEALYVISRFVFESMLMRMCMGMDKKWPDELMAGFKLPLPAVDVVRQGTLAITPKDAAESLRLLRTIHLREETALFRMEIASGALHKLQDVDSSLAVITTALASLRQGHVSWPRVAFQAVFVEAEKDYGMAMRLSDEIIEEGKRRGDVGAETLGWVARAQVACSYENADDAVPAYDRMLDMILKNSTDDTVLKSLVIAVPLCLSIGDPGTARRLLRVGLKRTARRPELEAVRANLEDIEESMKAEEW